MLLSLLRECFHVVEIRRVPSINNIRSISPLTTADSAVCIFYSEAKILFTGSSISRFGQCAYRKRCVFSTRRLKYYLLVVVFLVSDNVHIGKGRCLVFFISD